MATTTTTLQDSAAIFVVKNILDSVAYYRDTLGFTVAFQYGEPTFYAGVCRDNVTIHLQQAGKATRQPGQGGINIFVDDVDRVYEELKARNARTNKPPADYPYGMRDFDLNDPDGNFLCFGTEIGRK